MDHEGQSIKPSIARRIAYRLATGVKVFDSDPMEGGLSVSQWMRLWYGTHEGGRRTEWPDGGSLIGQSSIVVEMLDLVGEQIMKEATAPPVK